MAFCWLQEISTSLEINEGVYMSFTWGNSTANYKNKFKESGYWINVQIYKLYSEGIMANLKNCHSTLFSVFFTNNNYYFVSHFLEIYCNNSEDRSQYFKLSHLKITLERLKCCDFLFFLLQNQSRATENKMFDWPGKCLLSLTFHSLGEWNEW